MVINLAHFTLKMNVIDKFIGGVVIMIIKSQSWFGVGHVAGVAPLYGNGLASLIYTEEILYYISITGIITWRM